MPVGFPDYYGGLTLPVSVPEGGTGQTSVTDNVLLYGAGGSKMIETNVGASGQYLQIDPITLVPTFEDLSVDVSAITGILPITHGGTGTSTPALVPGSNISITGSWPDQTVALASSPTIDTLTLTNTSNGITFGGRDSNGKGLSLDSFANITMETGAATGDTWAVIDTNGNYVFTCWLDGTQKIELSTPLTIASGGTGTSSPALTAGTAISITGTWPNQTIKNTSNYASLAVPLPVTSGGTGTSSPALTAGTAISITGTWPNQTIKNTSNYASLAVPLPVTSGGTGTSSPALTAGSNIAISGTWPNQTIGLSANPAVSYIDLERTGDGYVLLRLFRYTGTYIGGFSTDSSGNPFLVLYDASGSGGGLIKGTSSGLEITNLTGALPTAAHTDITGRSTAISTTTIYTPSSAGMYRVSIQIEGSSTAGDGSASATIGWTQNGVAFSKEIVANFTLASGGSEGQATYLVYADSGTHITYSTTFTSGSGGGSYDIHVRVEAL